MKRLATIISVAETKTGVSQRDGRPWQMTDFVIKWTEEEPNCTAYECSLQVTTNQQIDRSKLEKAKENGEKIEVRFYPDVHEYNNRFFNNIRAYLPKEFEKVEPF